MLNKIFAMLLTTLMICFSVNVQADTASTNANNSETAKQYMSASAITAEVKQNLLTDSDIKSLHISVKTIKRKVILTGTVETQEQKDKAESIASNVEGVTSVVNHLVVKAKK